MLVSSAVRQLPYPPRTDVHDKNVQPKIIVEARQPFLEGGLVQIARDHNGIAGGILRFRALLRRNKRDPFAVRGPTHALPHSRFRTVCSFNAGQPASACAIGMCNHQPGFAFGTSIKRDPLPVRWPNGVSRRLSSSAKSNGGSAPKIHYPELAK